MVSLLKRSVIEAEDWLRYHPVVRDVIGKFKCWRDSVAPPRDHQALARSIIQSRIETIISTSISLRNWRRSRPKRTKFTVP